MELKEVIEKIPDRFYIVMFLELIKIFQDNYVYWLLKAIKEDDYIDLNSSTCGWDAAFHNTCIDLNLEWLSNYYDELSWDESDDFNAEIENIIINKVMGIEQ